jgi:NADH dehydrogenase [ubiquinone] 1 alpha subcomplex assembly factor 7
MLAEKSPLSLADFMAAANAVYYGTRDPLGVDGDFITAPEISQMFGELIGLWLCDIWMRAGQPVVHYVELGPGRGTLARDALRVMAKVSLVPAVHLVETSPILRLRQAETLSGSNLPSPTWHDSIASLPRDAALFIIANEFFDALPVHQIVRYGDGWFQRDVHLDAERGVASPVQGRMIPIDIVPETLRAAPEGSVIETCPAAVQIVGGLAQRMAAQGGAALIIDYGYVGPALGDTLQAVKAHRYASPYDLPGDQDLTAHVDFATLGGMADMNGVAVQGPLGQGQFLMRLGLAERTASLSIARPEAAAERAAERDRLAGEDAMGRLFRVMALRHPDWPPTDGF